MTKVAPSRGRNKKIIAAMPAEKKEPGAEDWSLIWVLLLVAWIKYAIDYRSDIDPLRSVSEGSCEDWISKLYFFGLYLRYFSQTAYC